MGMYDTLLVPRVMPDGYESRGYQTKDMRCDLDTYRISDAGRLEHCVKDMEPDGPPKKHPIFDFEYQPEKIVAERWVDRHYHGLLNFYDIEGSVNEGGARWHEYNAKFTDGQLVEIVLLQSYVIGDRMRRDEASPDKTNGVTGAD